MNTASINADRLAAQARSELSNDLRRAGFSLAAACVVDGHRHYHGLIVDAMRGRSDKLLAAQVTAWGNELDEAVIASNTRAETADGCVACAIAALKASDPTASCDPCREAALCEECGVEPRASGGGVALHPRTCERCDDRRVTALPTDGYRTAQVCA